MLGSAAGAFVAIFLLFAVIAIASIAVWVWGLVDAAQRPDWAYEQTGSNKIMWVVLIAVLGWIVSIIYLAAIRPKLREAELAGPRARTWAPPAYAPAPGAPYAQPQPTAGGAGPRRCPSCGSAVPEDGAFCSRCGRSL